MHGRGRGERPAGPTRRDGSRPGRNREVNFIERWLSTAVRPALRAGAGFTWAVARVSARSALGADSARTQDSSTCLGH